MERRPVAKNDDRAHGVVQQMLTDMNTAEERATLVLGSYNLGKQLNQSASLAERVQVENIDKSITACREVMAENKKRYDNGTYDETHTPEICNKQDDTMRTRIAELEKMRAEPAARAQQLEDASKILSAFGELVWLKKEAEIDAVTAISGSGPAYVFLFAEGMMEAAINMGFTKAAAKKLVFATL